MAKRSVKKTTQSEEVRFVQRTSITDMDGHKWTAGKGGEVVTQWWEPTTDPIRRMGEPDKMTYDALINQAFRIQTRKSSTQKFYVNVSVETSQGWKWFRTSVHEVRDFRNETEFTNIVLGAVGAGQDYEAPQRLIDSEYSGPAVQIVYL